ncbi:MAG: aquaporin family protein [Microbacteriaceae bacterium]|nr:aquaporin family protein [Microbacteriaceae bacterium]
MPTNDQPTLIQPTASTTIPLPRRLAAETLGSLALTAIVVGSGIAAQTLSPTDVGLQLAENAVVTAFGLLTLILVLGPLSGAHFNPVVTLVDAIICRRPRREILSYALAQTVGCIAGSVLANLMFDRAAVSISTHERLTGAHFLAEIVATTGLIVVIFTLVRSGRERFAAPAVAAYIGAAYFFTSSTSFANPAITVGRMFSDSFAGIAPASVLGYISAQLIGAALGCAIVRGLYPHSPLPVLRNQ